MNPLHRPTLWLPVVLGAALGLVACPLIPDEDNFRCGVLVEGVVTRCDRPGERCLCTETRCVFPENSCDAGYRYSFPRSEDNEFDDNPLGCVQPEKLKAEELVGPNILCEGGQEPECGWPRSDGVVPRCASRQFCYCPERRCAEPWAACTADGGLGARFVTTGTCVGQPPGDASIREREDGTCPGSLLTDLFPDAGSPAGGSDAGTDSGTP